MYVKLQSHIQQSVQRRSNSKLSFKFFGPYLILQRIGQVAYKLQLPAASQIHPIIHVSQLKKALPPHMSISDDNELQLLITFHSLPSRQVLVSRLKLVGGRFRWSSYTHSMPGALGKLGAQATSSSSQVCFYFISIVRLHCILRERECHELLLYGLD